MTLTPTQSEPAATSLLVPLAAEAGDLSTVLLHPAGGGVGCYLELAEQLARRGPVSAVRACGLLPGEQPHNAVEEMVAAYLPLLKRLRPGLLVGWSLGGVLAWELAAELARTKDAPAVVLVDSMVDGAVMDGHDAAAERDVVANIESLSRAEVGPELRRTIRAHVEASLSHAVRRRFDGDVLVLSCGDEDAATRLGDWQSLGSRVAVAHVPGGHFEVFSAGTLPTLCAQVDKFLSRVVPHGRAR